LIEFVNIAKKFRVPGGFKPVINLLNYRFPRRNIAVLGGNGAGKSTLLRLISGTELPDRGHIMRYANVSFPLGFQGSFKGSLSGLENTRFIARIYGQDTERVIDFVREFAELDAHFFSPVKTYSSGMRAKLAFGVSLAIDFDCYLVDEITEVGDQRFKRKARKAFDDKLTTANIILVSHAIATLKSYCDMGVIVRDGDIKVFDDIDEAISDHEAYMSR
jgi:capsular polysaccharide transport system ATP-binding protein